MLITNTERFHTSVGVAIRSKDMSSNPPEVLVRTKRGFTHVTGTPHAGGYRFTRVPQGEFYLKTGNTYVVTDERHVDVGKDLLGREDTVFSARYDEPVSLFLTNLAPWQDPVSYTAGSRLQLVSGQLDVAADVLLDTYVAPGQTEVGGSASAYNIPNTFPTFEYGKGDRLYLNQLTDIQGAPFPSGGRLVSETIVRSLQVSAFNHIPGTGLPMSIGGVMQPVPKSDFSLEWRLGDYLAYSQDMHPAAEPRNPTFFIHPVAHGPAEGWVGYSGEAFSFTLPIGASYTLTDELTYGNPYPSTWRMVGHASYSFRNHEVPPGTGIARSLTGAISSVDYLENLVAAPIRPKLTPVRALTIDGLSATTQRMVSNSSPTVSWTPPATGAPSAYRLSLLRLNASNHALVQQAHFILPGTATEVRIPTGLLASNATYALKVTALDSPNSEVTRKPFTLFQALPYHSADTVSSFFTTP